MRKLVFLALLMFAGNLAASPDPYETVKVATEDLLKKLVEAQPLYAKEPKSFFHEVDKTLGPFIDFDGFSRNVMAKYFRRASDEQKQQFKSVFRIGLIETYAKALLEFDNEEVIVLKPQLPSKKPDRSKISLEVHSHDGSVYKIDYSLRLIDDTWKLRNIVINGINIGLQFRSQFGASMSKYKGDIDTVIDNWSVDA